MDTVALQPSFVDTESLQPSELQMIGVLTYSWRWREMDIALWFVKNSGNSKCNMSFDRIACKMFHPVLGFDIGGHDG